MREHSLKTGIVHEWLTNYAGSERVVEQVLQIYPESTLHALVDFLPEDQRHMLGGRPVETSFLQRMPFARHKFRGYLPLMPLAVEQFDLTDLDIIISSNHAVAKGVLTRPDQLHICYVHTPIRYAWDLHHQYLRDSKLTRGIRSAVARIILHYMRLWDFASAQRVDVFVANSRFVAQRIRKIYGRDAEVVYPPCDVDAFDLCTEKEDFYVAASRLVPYKKIDLIVEAFRRLPDKQLVVIGDGPMYKSLAAQLPPNVQLLGFQPHEVLKKYLQQAKGFIFAAEEDFGIAPVEAQACGTPVLAYGRGGALETVVDGVTGRFFARQTAESIVEALQGFDAEVGDFDAYRIRQQAERFSQEQFRHAFSELVQRHWDRFKLESVVAEPVFGFGPIVDHETTRFSHPLPR